MLIRSSFVSNSSSSSFVLALPKGFTLSEPLIIPDYVESFRGFEGRIYTRAEAFKFFKEFFTQKSLEEIKDILKNDAYFEQYNIEDYDYYFGYVNGDSNRVYADLEHRLFPALADITISHH